MITQYSESYTAPSADIQNIVANSVSLLDKYVLMQTDEYEYTALVQNLANKKTEEITISRISTSGYNNRYQVSREEVSEFSYDVTNEYYTFSNCGFGRSLDVPAYEGAVTYGIAGITVLLFFAVIFKGVLFNCLKRKR